MKLNTKICLSILIAICLLFTACDGLFGGKSDPVITEKTITDPSDENYPKDVNFPAGTTIKFKKVEEEEVTTTDYTAKLPDETVVVYHGVEEGKEGKDGKIVTTVTSTSTTTFPATDTSGKKSEVVDVWITDEFNATKGEYKKVTTTTEFKDGSKEESYIESEGYTGNFKSEKTTYDASGSKSAYEETTHTEIPEADQKWIDGMKITSTELNTEYTYDEQGNAKTKVVSEYTNRFYDGSYNVLEKNEYTYVNGEPKLTKSTENTKIGRNETRVTVPNDDGTKTITIDIKKNTDGTKLGSGSGITDKNGVTTITINYKNGIDFTTVEAGDKVTKEILITTSEGKVYWEKSVTEKGVLTSKDCEYLYDESAGIVFKTISTFSNGTETKKSGRYIKDEGLAPASYDEKYVKIPNEYIYDSLVDLKIKSDGQNADSYSTFTTETTRGNYETIDYPYDSSVDMTNLHLLTEE